MAETTSPPTELQTSGGFRIQISQEGLSATQDNSLISRFMLYLFYCFLFLYAVYAFQFQRANFVPVLIVFAIFLPGFLLSQDHNLRCTRNALEVIDVLHGRTRRTRSFQRSEIKDIRFGVVSPFSKYSSCGLIFTVAGKNIKSLYGLKCVEAQKILNELQRLGYDVSFDPDMPMAVEMEQSRRQFWGTNQN
jgi:hypothetical protein